MTIQTGVRRTGRDGCLVPIISVLVAAALGASSASADDVFRIGMAAKVDARKANADREGIRAVFAKALNRPVELFLAPNMPALIDAHASGRVHYSVLSAQGYVVAKNLCDCVEPLVAPTTASGAIGTRSVLLVNPETALELDDVARARIAYGPPGNLTGDIIPVGSFTWEGKPFLQSTLSKREMGSLAAALEAIETKKVDAIFGWQLDDAVDEENEAAHDGLATRIKSVTARTWVPLWESELVPFGPHVVSNTLSEDDKLALREAVLNIHESAPLAFDALSPTMAGPFRPVTREDYQAINRMLLGRVRGN